MQKATQNNNHIILKPLIKKAIKDNWKIWAIITSIGALVLSLNTMAYASSGDDFLGDFNLILEMHFSNTTMFVLIYVVIVANRLIAAQIDNGSMAFIMVNPVKRNQVSRTQALFLVSSLFVMFLIVTLIGVVMITITGIEASTGVFILMNVGSLLLMLAISGISYLASCIFNRSSHSFALGAGLPIAFTIFSILGSLEEVSEPMRVFNFLTINSLFNIADIAANSSNMIWQFSTLFIISVVCYISGMIYFKKKDLPL